MEDTHNAGFREAPPASKIHILLGLAYTVIGAPHTDSQCSPVSEPLIVKN